MSLDQPSLADRVGPTAAHQADEMTARMMPAIRKLVADELARARVPAPKAVMLTVDAEIMDACHRVARAVDQLAQARFSGHGEAGARKALVRAAERLESVMKRHGRV